MSLSPLDAFLLTRFAAFLPHPVTVLDLSADATDGDSVAVLHAADIPVVSLRIGDFALTAQPDWRHSVAMQRNGANRSESLSATAPIILLDDPAPNGIGDWDTIMRALPTEETILILLAETPDTVPQIERHLDWLAERLPHAPILLLPLGAIGESDLLARAVVACPPDGPRRLIALRDQAPFFASSELGLVFASNDTMVPVALKRLAALVEGNFQFLPLVYDAVTTATHIVALEAELTQLQETYAHTEMAHMQTEEARERAERACTLAEAALAEKTRYAQWLESRLNHLESEYIPWKNSVLTGWENEVRNLHASKAVRVERLLRRVLRRG